MNNVPENEPGESIERQAERHETYGQWFCRVASQGFPKYKDLVILTLVAVVVVLSALTYLEMRQMARTQAEELEVQQQQVEVQQQQRVLIRNFFNLASDIEWDISRIASDMSGIESDTSRISRIASDMSGIEWDISRIKAKLGIY